MDVETTRLPGVVVLTPRRFEDERGFFCETWNAETHAAAGIILTWKQDNLSMSRSTGTLRGLHYQEPPRAQAKLVRCSRGAITDVILDIRRGSPTEGAWVAVDLDAATGRQVLVPEGFAHGFVTRQPDTEVIYKCTDTYSPAHDRAIRWDSAGIDWKLDAPPVLSERDRSAPALDDVTSPFVWSGT